MGFRVHLQRRLLVPVWNDFLWLWCPMISGDQRDQSFPDIHLTVEEKPWKKLQPGKLTWPGIEHGPAAWEVKMLPLDHSGDLFLSVRLCRVVGRVPAFQPAGSLFDSRQGQEFLFLPCDFTRVLYLYSVLCYVWRWPWHFIDHIFSESRPSAILLCSGP